jgi:mono/diheme cytochrome c family protein
MKPAALLVSATLLFTLSACKVSKPGSLESTVVKSVKRNVTVGGKDWKNPAPDTPDSAKEGQGHFGHHCQICHGLDGQNTGVPFAIKMSPPVADLSDKDVQGYTDGQLKWIIENGIEPSGMPGWKGILDDDEMWKIVRFLRHLPAKGSLGTPAVFKEEAEEHEQMEQGNKPGEPAKKAPPHEHRHTH